MVNKSSAFAWETGSSINPGSILPPADDDERRAENGRRRAISLGMFVIAPREVQRMMVVMCKWTLEFLDQLLDSGVSYPVPSR